MQVLQMNAMFATLLQISDKIATYDLYVEEDGHSLIVRTIKSLWTSLGISISFEAPSLKFALKVSLSLSLFILLSCR